MLALPPALRRLAGPHLDGLSEHIDTVAVDGRDRPDHLPLDGYGVRDEPAGIGPRDDAHDMADAQITGAADEAVDGDRHILRIGDAAVIDDDAAEALDRADEAGAADTPVGARTPLRREAGAADPDIAGPLRRRDGRTPGHRAAERGQQRPARQCEAAAHPWLPPAGASPGTSSRKT